MRFARVRMLHVADETIEPQQSCYPLNCSGIARKGMKLISRAGNLAPA